MKARLIIVLTVLVVGVGLLVYSTSATHAKPTQTAPPGGPPAGPIIAIPAGQSYCQQATFSTTSTSYVGVASAVTVNNTTGVTKIALLRWTGVVAHLTVGGYVLVAPMRDGVALPSTPGEWFIGFDLEGSGAVSDDFGIQWPVSLTPGVHTVQPAMASNDGIFRNIDGYCFSVEWKTK